MKSSRRDSTDEKLSKKFKSNGGNGENNFNKIKNKLFQEKLDVDSLTEMHNESRKIKERADNELADLIKENYRAVYSDNIVNQKLPNKDRESDDFLSNIGNEYVSTTLQKTSLSESAKWKLANDIQIKGKLYDTIFTPLNLPQLKILQEQGRKTDIKYEDDIKKGLFRIASSEVLFPYDDSSMKLNKKIDDNLIDDQYFVNGLN